jgi:hypothetical protein
VVWHRHLVRTRGITRPKTKVSNWNLLFVVKLQIRRHKVVRRLIDNRASLNLIMRKTFIEMDHSLLDPTSIHDVIPGQSSTLIGRINLEVSCGLGDNKCREMLTFEVASFNISYNCILGRSFLLKFMTVIHTPTLSRRWLTRKVSLP